MKPYKVPSKWKFFFSNSEKKCAKITHATVTYTYLENGHEIYSEKNKFKLPSTILFFDSWRIRREIIEEVDKMLTKHKGKFLKECKVKLKRCRGITITNQHSSKFLGANVTKVYYEIEEHSKRMAKDGQDSYKDYCRVYEAEWLRRDKDVK